MALKVQRENERQVFWDGNNICIKKKNYNLDMYVEDYIIYINNLFYIE